MHMKILQQQTWCTFAQMWNFIKNNAYAKFNHFTKEEIIHEIRFLKTAIPIFSRTYRFPVNNLYVHVDNILIKTVLDKIVLSETQEAHISSFLLLSSYFTADSCDTEKIVVYDREKFESTYRLTWKRH